MDVELLKIVVNTGLCVLIWTVQLVIYPGLCYYNTTDIKRWHPIYTNRITVIVLPLMLAQLVIYGLAAYHSPTALHLGTLALVISTWLITFLFAVPLHNVIGSPVPCAPARQKLVKINWWRTALWTLILIINLVYYEQ